MSDFHERYPNGSFKDRGEKPLLNYFNYFKAHFPNEHLTQNQQQAIAVNTEYINAALEEGEFEHTHTIEIGDEVVGHHYTSRAYVRVGDGLILSIGLTIVEEDITDEQLEDAETYQILLIADSEGNAQRFNMLPVYEQETQLTIGAREVINYSLMECNNQWL